MDALSSLLASACAFALVFVFSASAAALTLEHHAGTKKNYPHRSHLLCGHSFPVFFSLITATSNPKRPAILLSKQ